MAAMAAFRARKPLLDGLASGAVPEAGLAALSDGFRMEANDPADHPNGRRSAARRPPTERVYRPGSNFLEAAPRLGRPRRIGALIRRAGIDALEEGLGQVYSRVLR